MKPCSFCHNYDCVGKCLYEGLSRDLTTCLEKRNNEIAQLKLRLLAAEELAKLVECLTLRDRTDKAVMMESNFPNVYDVGTDEWERIVAKANEALEKWEKLK